MQVLFSEHHACAEKFMSNKCFTRVQPPPVLPVLSVLIPAHNLCINIYTHAHAHAHKHTNTHTQRHTYALTHTRTAVQLHYNTIQLPAASPATVPINGFGIGDGG